MSLPKRHVSRASGVVILALALVAAGVLVALADRFAFRVDVTTTGDQALAPRTMAILDQLRPMGDVEIAVAVDAGAVEPLSRQTVLDVLDLFDSTDGVRSSEIDIGSPVGQAEFRRLLARLIERERPGVEQHVEALQLAADGAAEAARAMSDRIAPALVSLANASRATGGDDSGASQILTEWAMLVRRGSGLLDESAERARAALAEPDPVLPIPPSDEHERMLGLAMAQRAAELEDLSSNLAGLADLPGLSQASGFAREIGALRDALAREADALARLPRLDVVRVADALASSEVALVVGPEGAGVAGVDIRTLYTPTIVATDGSRRVGDVRLRAEELFASALASVGSAARPVVVFTHAGAGSFLDVPFFAGLRRRLDQRGIDIAEWRLAEDDVPPTLDALDPDRVRPWVYVVISPDSSARRTEDGLSGPEQAAAVGRALAGLLAARESVLVSLNPSVLPSYGESDPVAGPLAELGVIGATASPLLSVSADARAAGIATEFTMLPGEGAHPILSATSNLPTTLSWPIGLRVEEGAGIRATSLLEIGAEPGVWGETQWLRLWQTPAEQRGLLPDPPTFDEGADETGPWTVAMAIERDDGSRQGRVVVVGSNGRWFADPLAFAFESVDGRVSPISPGNAELFESSVLWLAGQDELIAASAVARARPMIGPLAPSTLGVLRWVLVAGLPIGALALGVAWRLIRG